VLSSDTINGMMRVIVAGHDITALLLTVGYVIISGLLLCGCTRHMRPHCPCWMGPSCWTCCAGFCLPRALSSDIAFCKRIWFEEWGYSELLCYAVSPPPRRAFLMTVCGATVPLPNRLLPGCCYCCCGCCGCCCEPGGSCRFELLPWFISCASEGRSRSPDR